MADEIRRRIRWENKERQRKKREEKGQLRDESLYLKRTAFTSSPPLTSNPFLKNETIQQSVQTTFQTEPTLNLDFTPNERVSRTSSHFPRNLDKKCIQNSPQHSCNSIKNHDINRQNFDDEDDDDDDDDLVRDALILAKKNKLQVESLKESGQERRKNLSNKIQDDIITRSSCDDDEDLIRDVQILRQKKRDLTSSVKKNKEYKSSLSLHEKLDHTSPPGVKSKPLSSFPDKQVRKRTPEEKPKLLHLLEETNDTASAELSSASKVLKPISNNESLWTDSESESSLGKKKSVSSNIKRKQPSRSQKGMLTTTDPSISMEDQISNSILLHDSQESSNLRLLDEFHELMPYFENPKLGPPSDLVPLVLKYANGQRVVPAAINRYLKGYQREGIVFLHNRIANQQGVILGDDMGLGKTIQVISLLAALLEKHGTAQDKFDLEKCQKRIQQQLERHRSEQERTLRLGIVGPCFSNPTEGIIMSAWAPILVLVPPSVIENWRNEFQAWGYFGVAAYAGPSREQEIERIYNGLEEIMICGKSILQNEEDLLAVKKVKWKLIIVDEYHQYKNFRTKLYSGLKSLRDTCGAPIIGLTGTLMQNNHEELWSEVDLVNPGFLGTWEEFKDDTSVPIKLGRTKTADDAAVKEGNQVRDWLKTKLKSFYLQRRKADVLKDDLPEKNERVVFCELSPLQKRIYQHMMTLPDIVLVKYANAPCECGINQSIFQGFKQMRSEKEKIAYQRNHRNDIVPRKSCCHKRPLNIFRFHAGEEFYDPRAPLWRWQHEKLVQQDSSNIDTATDCKSCPYCISFAVLDKLYKLSSHVSLLQLTKHPDDLPKGSRAWKDAKKALDFAKVAFPEDVLSMLPGGSYIREDGIMDDHASLSGKMQMLSDLLSEFNRRDARILLFSFSTQTLDLIQNFVKAQGYSYLRLDGNTPTRARQGLVDLFQKDNSIFLFLISTKAGGLGLNLTAANVVIVFDVDFNPSNDEQSQDRAYRIGQTRDVLVIRLVSRGTIEELKYIRQLYKLQLKHYTIGPSQAEQTYDENEAARMFRAVEGDKERKGELFGMENLLKFKDGSFLDELWKSKTICDTGEWKGFEKFALHSALDIAGGMEALSKDGIEDVGGSISDEAFREAATRAIFKEKGIKDNDIRLSVENILQGQNTKSHQDYLRSDRGDALFKPGDTGFEEEMGGYSQAEHYVMENACIYGQRHDVENSPTATRPSMNARNDQCHPSPLPLKPPRLQLNMSPPSPVTSASIVPIIIETNTEVGSKLPGNANRRSLKPRLPRSVSSLNTSSDNGVSPQLPSYFKKTKLRFSSKDLYIPGKQAKRKKT